MLSGDFAVAFCSAHSVARLQQTQSNSGCPSGALCDQRWHLLIDVPMKCSKSLMHQVRQIVHRIKIKTKCQSHPISKRLQQAVFVSRAEEQSEIGDWNALGHPPLATAA